MITVVDKKTLRKQALEKRAEFSRDLSIKIMHKILNSPEFKFAKNIALYMPIKNEIDLTDLFKIRDKNYYLPRCNNNELEFVKFDNNLVDGAFGILEPKGDKINPEILDIVYIPALMANKKCYRLGYGKGFYDRFFAKNNIKAKKIIVISNELISDEFVEDKFDFQCDEIISA